MDVPPHFSPLAPMDKVMESFQPLYQWRGPAGLVLGFRVGVEHCNPRGTCHGGIWATFLDLQLGMFIAQATDMGGPTISLTIDYLDAALPGEWVEAECQMLRQTRNLAFAQCLATTDGRLAVRANGIFRPMKKLTPLK